MCTQTYTHIKKPTVVPKVEFPQSAKELRKKNTTEKYLFLVFGFLVGKLSYCDHPLKITAYQLFSGKRMKYHFPLQYFVKLDEIRYDLYHYDYSDNAINHQVPSYCSEVITSTPCDTQGQQCQPWHGSLKSRAKKDYHPILTPDCNPAFTQSLLSLC